MAFLSASKRKAITRFAERESAKNDSMHRMPHLRQTAVLAARIARIEGADAEACWAAGMLHDIRKNSPGDHGAIGAKAAETFLESIGLPPSFVEKVRDGILFHNKGFRRGPPERQILWDADKLPILRPAGFKSRMLPYWTSRLGRKKGVEQSIREYRFFRPGLHTKTAIWLMLRDSKKMEALISSLGGGVMGGRQRRKSNAHL
jgi:hypothetical protein